MLKFDQAKRLAAGLMAAKTVATSRMEEAAGKSQGCSILVIVALRLEQSYLELVFRC